MAYGYLLTTTNLLFIIGEIKEFFKDTIYSGYVDCTKTILIISIIFVKLQLISLRFIKPKQNQHRLFQKLCLIVYLI